MSYLRKMMSLLGKVYGDGEFYWQQSNNIYGRKILTISVHTQSHKDLITGIGKKKYKEITAKNR